MNATARARELVRFNPARRRWPIALKAAIAVSLPVLIATLLRAPEVGLTCTLGAFAVLYGAESPWRFRIKMLGAMAAALTLSAAAGALAALIHPAAVVALLVLLAGLGSALCVTLKIGPPGAYLLVLVAGIGGFLTDHGVHAGLVIAMAALGGVVAVVVGMADLVTDLHRPEREAVDAAEIAVAAFEEATDPVEIKAARAAASTTLHLAWTSFRDGIGDQAVDGRNADLFERIGILETRYTRRSADLAGQTTTGAEPHPWGNPVGDDVEIPVLDPEFEAEQLRDSSLGRPDPAYLLRQAFHWPSEIWLIVLRIAVATLASGAVALALGLDHVYWGAAFAALVLHQGGSRHAQTLRGIQRLLGTMAGLGLFAVILTWRPSPLWLVIVVFVLLFGVEMLIVRNYAVAAILLTPLALIVAHAGDPTLRPESLLIERGIDTLIATGFALAALWLTGRGSALLLVRAHARRSVLATERVMRDLAESRYAGAEAREHRRQLYYELLEMERATGQGLVDAPAAVRPYRHMADEVATLGYLVLGACWHPQVDRARDAFGRAVEPLQAITQHPINRPRAAAEIEAEVVAVQRVITDWR